MIVKLFKEIQWKDLCEAMIVKLLRDAKERFVLSNDFS